MVLAFIFSFFSLVSDLCLPNKVHVSVKISLTSFTWVLFAPGWEQLRKAEFCDHNVKGTCSTIERNLETRKKEILMCSFPVGIRTIVGWVLGIQISKKTWETPRTYTIGKKIKI